MTTTTSDTMDDAGFAELSRALIERVRTRLDSEDPDVVEAVLEADVLKLVFPTGSPFVLNTQRPTREIWLAADRQAWHFRFDGAAWIDKRSGDELWSTLTKVIAVRTKTSLSF